MEPYEVSKMGWLDYLCRALLLEMICSVDFDHADCAEDFDE